MAAAELKKNTISLKSADGHIHEVSLAIAKQMQTVQSFIEEESFVPSTAIIPLPNVNSVELSKIIEYLNYYHREDKAADTSDNEKEFNAQFVKELTHDQLKLLIRAANYLNVEDLLGFLSQVVAELMKNKCAELVREFFDIVTDFNLTEEEEEMIRKASAWAFEGDADQD